MLLLPSWVTSSASEVTLSAKKTEVQIFLLKILPVSIWNNIWEFIKNSKSDILALLHLFYKRIAVDLLTLVCIFIDIRSQIWKQIEPLFFLWCSVSCLFFNPVGSLLFLLVLLPFFLVTLLLNHLSDWCN